MKLLRSPWVISLLALVINLGVVTGTLLTSSTGIVQAALAARAAHTDEPSPLDPEYWTLQFEAFEKVMQAQQEREAQLTARAQALDEREQLLKNESAELEAIRESLRQDRETLRQVLFQVDASEAQNLKFLATTFAEMPPEQLVPIVAALSDEQAIKVILQMKPDVIAALFTAMVEADGPDKKNAQRLAFFSQEIRRFQRQETLTP